MFRKKLNIIVQININIDLIIDYEKSDFNIKKIFDIFDDFDINILNNSDIDIFGLNVDNFDINIFGLNAVIVLIMNIINITFFKKLIIRCFFNIFFIMNINITIKRCRLLKNS